MGSEWVGGSSGYALAPWLSLFYENLEIFQKTEIMGLEEAMDIKKKSGYVLGGDEKWCYETKFYSRTLPLYPFLGQCFLFLIPLAHMARKPCVCCIKSGSVILIVF